MSTPPSPSSAAPLRSRAPAVACAPFSQSVCYVRLFLDCGEEVTEILLRGKNFRYQELGEWTPPPLSQLSTDCHHENPSVKSSALAPLSLSARSGGFVCRPPPPHAPLPRRRRRGPSCRPARHRHQGGRSTCHISERNIRNDKKQIFTSEGMLSVLARIATDPPGTLGSRYFRGADCLRSRTHIRPTPRLRHRVRR